MLLENFAKFWRIYLFIYSFFFLKSSPHFDWVFNFWIILWQLYILFGKKNLNMFSINVIFLITNGATLENWGEKKDIVMVQIFWFVFWSWINLFTNEVFNQRKINISWVHTKFQNILKCYWKEMSWCCG